MLSAQSLVRPAYLQKPTQNSIIIRWRTDVPTDSRVQYGSSPTNLSQTVDVSGSFTDHEVALTGLSTNTVYYYSIGTTTQQLAGGDNNHQFRTFPSTFSTPRMKAWVIGDFGKRNSEQRQVADSWAIHPEFEDTDIWLWLGDNAYQDGTDNDYTEKVFDSINGYGPMWPRIPFLPTPGNHDYLSIQPPVLSIDPVNHSGAYYDAVNVYTNAEAGGTPSGMEAFYSYDYGNVHFLSINSELGTIVGSSNDWIGTYPLFNIFASPFTSSPLTNWLHQDLSSTTKRWKVAYWHQPPFTDGSHETGTFWEIFMEAMRNNIIPILEQYGVDLVLCGHSHVYERSYLIKGHYDDPNTWDPNTMLVDGGSGTDSLGEAYVKDLS
ncbi:MAG: metallophosphoesterase family protein, partial [Bacteroidota bacterium]